MKCIPKIIKIELNKGYTNMVLNYNTDMSYFTNLNSFKLKKCLIGPFTEEIDIEYIFLQLPEKN